MGASACPNVWIFELAALTVNNQTCNSSKIQPPRRLSRIFEPAALSVNRDGREYARNMGISANTPGRWAFPAARDLPHNWRNQVALGEPPVSLRKVNWDQRE